MADTKGTIQLSYAPGNSFSFAIDMPRHLDRLAEIPAMAPVVQAGADILLNRTRAAAPVRTGDLRWGLIRCPGPESSIRFRHKTVYDIVFDWEMNDVFKKHTKAGKEYYYPASMEYGFRLRGGGRYAGKYFMRNSAIAYSDEFSNLIAERVDKILEVL